LYQSKNARQKALASSMQPHGHRDQPRLRAGGVDLDPFDPVIGERRDPVALLQPKPHQRIGEATGAFVPQREAHRALEIADADPLWLQPGLGAQRPAHGEDRGHAVSTE